MLQSPLYSRIMHTPFEDRDKILRRCGHHNVLSLDKKFHCTLAPEGAFDHSFWGCGDFCNEAAQLRTMRWIGRVKAEIGRMLANFAAQLSLRNFYLLPHWQCIMPGGQQQPQA